MKITIGKFMLIIHSWGITLWKRCKCGIWYTGGCLAHPKEGENDRQKS